MSSQGLQKFRFPQITASFCFPGLSPRCIFRVPGFEGATEEGFALLRAGGCAQAPMVSVLSSCPWHEQGAVQGSVPSCSRTCSLMLLCKSEDCCKIPF